MVEQLSFSTFPSILNFDFYLTLWSFLVFWDPNGLFSGSIAVLGSTLVLEQFSLSLIPSILVFEFDLILGSLLTLRNPNGQFLGSW